MVEEKQYSELHRTILDATKAKLKKLRLGIIAVVAG